MARARTVNHPPDRVLGYAAAAERTALAWERTGFGLLGVGALLVHDSQQRASVAQLAFSITVMAVGAVTSVVVAPIRYRSIIDDVGAGRTPRLRRLTPLIALAVCLAALSSGALAWP